MHQQTGQTQDIASLEAAQRCVWGVRGCQSSRKFVRQSQEPGELNCSSLSCIRQKYCQYGRISSWVIQISTSNCQSAASVPDMQGEVSHAATFYSTLWRRILNQEEGPDVVTVQLGQDPQGQQTSAALLVERKALIAQV